VVFESRIETSLTLAQYDHLTEGIDVFDSRDYDSGDLG
jgi:hypothetical protein